MFATGRSTTSGSPIPREHGAALNGPSITRVLRMNNAKTAYRPLPQVSLRPNEQLFPTRSATEGHSTIRQVFARVGHRCECCGRKGADWMYIIVIP